MNFEKKRLSNINFLYPTVASVAVVADVAVLIRDIQLDWYVRLYCCTALFAIVFICVIGYTQYVTLIRQTV